MEKKKDLQLTRNRQNDELPLIDGRLSDASLEGARLRSVERAKGRIKEVFAGDVKIKARLKTA